MKPDHSSWRVLFVLIGFFVVMPVQAQDGDQGSLSLEDVDTDSADVSQEQLKRDKIAVSKDIFRRDWNDPPFKTSYFTYTDKQLREKWDYLVRGLRVPYPSLDLIKYAFEKYPQVREDVPSKLVNNPRKYQERVLDSWRYFFAGRYQEARENSLDLGPIGLVPGALSELMYGYYMADRKSTKDMLLQDVVNTANSFDNTVQKMRHDKRKKVREMGGSVILGKAYAMARIAEEAPVPVAVARGYLRKIKDLANQVLEVMPNHPLGHAFRAGVDSGIMRRVGRFTGRMTYGARTTVAEDSFQQALDLVPDVAIVQYEYANSLIYMNRKRDLNKAMRHLEKATKIRPQFAMEALDSMYAYKRLQEVRLYALNYRSFREFDKDRFNFTRTTDHNLTSVNTKPLTMKKLKNPDNYKMPEQ